jgi:AcrR family transcriptional regulator
MLIFTTRILKLAIDMKKAPLKPRKIPIQSRSAATVAAILEAAARILEASGFEGYTTNAVAERAGVSVGSLYQYFPNKDVITHALIMREMTILLADIAELHNGNEGLAQLIGAAVNNQLRRPKLASLLDIAEERLPADAEVEQLGQQMSTIFHRCLKAPDLPSSARSPHAAGDLIAIIKGMVNAAGRRGETNASALSLRVKKAVFGYLK